MKARLLSPGPDRTAVGHQSGIRRPQPRIGFAAVVSLILMLGFATITQGAPTNGSATIWLESATVERAKALALDAALIKGWRLTESGRDYAIFETPLDQPASDGPPDASAHERTLLRIDARFSDFDHGVEARLRAEEVWRAGTARAWRIDITDRYRGHLERALKSLRDQWQQFAETDAKGAPTSTSQTMIQPAREEQEPRLTKRQPEAQARLPTTWGADRTAQDSESSGSFDVGEIASQVGTWAFEAERIARDRGCTLTDRGAVLVDESSGTEIHRVACAGRQTMRVACNRSRCWVAR